MCSPQWRVQFTKKVPYRSSVIAVRHGFHRNMVNLESSCSKEGLRIRQSPPVDQSDNRVRLAQIFALCQ